MSANMSTPLFEIGESVPRATVTPSRSISGTGATPPEASFMFDTGQCATATPRFARVRASLIVTHTQCAAARPGPGEPVFAEPLDRAKARFRLAFGHRDRGRREVRVYLPVLPLRDILGGEV